MVLGGPVAVVPLLFAIVFAGGLVVGVAGFGYAIVATSALATVLDPRRAVVVMIIPVLAANVSLTRELDRKGLRTCARRFWPYVLAAVVGTVLGMAMLGRVPTGPLTLALGLFTLGYIGLNQPWFAVPGLDRLLGRCFTEGTGAKVGLGLVSGFVFGASNVGVQVVAYLDSLELDRSTFVGVLAMILVGVSGVRVLAAVVMGLYGSTGVIAVSAAAAVPGLVGVAIGRRARPHLPDRVTEGGIYLLLAIIGLRLTTNGLGVG